MKGTRRGLEAIIGLFGYTYSDNLKNKGDFSIDEYIVEAIGEYPDYCETSRLRATFDYVNGDENINFMQGYSVAKVENFDEKTGEDKSYLIPWFNKEMKYKYPIYFQSKGGWGKTLSKTINKDITLVKELIAHNNLDIYDETSPYLRFVNNLDDLISLSESEIKSGLICYVEDITNIESKGYKDKDIKGNYSHYFILGNIAYSVILGMKDDCYGWRNIRTTEYDGVNTPTIDGKKVLYLETLVSNEKGNNSHTGKGEYDDGVEYFNLYKNIFAKDIEKGVIRKVTDEDDIIDIEKAGFKLSGYIKDNNKIYFFGEVDDADGLDKISNNVFYNPETKGRDRSEMAANSIINTKHLTVRFKINGDDEMKQYIKNVVLKYAYEMIPSTSILEILFDEEKSLFKSPESKEELYTLSWSINNSAINE